VAIFGPRANLLTKTALLSAIVLALFLGGLLWIIPVTNYTTNSQFAPQQPVPFSHEHHVGGLGLDCRYCHNAVEVSSSAGMPPTETCMTCHSQIWNQSSMLQPVRDSLQNNVPIQWNRVHNLPDFVYFNHSIHVQKGIGCSSCHGQVNQMPLTWKTQTLQMGWCLGCHRAPEQYLRPPDQIFNMDWQPPANQLVLGRQLAQQYHILSVSQLTGCSTCHH
jgi:hypothetical protein